MPKHINQCEKCQNEYSTYNPNQKFCSRQCYKSTITGSGNPNYNKKWTDEQKQKQAELIKSKVDDEYRYKAGSANRGKKFSKNRIDLMHGHRTSESYSHPHSDESRIKIGIKSKEKFKNPGFLEKYRQTMIEKGFWIDPTLKSDWEIYRVEAHWQESLVEHFSKGSFEKFKEIGMYSLINPIGGVRDHMYSKKEGFDNGVFPEILRHPANLEFITHSENSKKARTYVSSITLDQLFERIHSFIGNWHEQQVCENLIRQYIDGNRWKRKENTK